MKNKMDKPLTGYLALFGFTVLSVANETAEKFV